MKWHELRSWLAALARGASPVGAAAVFAIASVVAALAVSALRAPVYMAESRFAPQVSQPQPSALGGIASQMGISLPTGNSNQSVDFYAQLLHSRDLMRDAVLARYPLPDGGQGNLIEAYGISGSSSGALAQAMGRLESSVAVGIDARAHVVTLRTEAPSAALAAGINQKLLDLVAEFNQNRRRSQAGAERRFVEARLADAKGDLAASQNALRAFLERNHRIGASPRLRLESERMESEILLKQQVYVSLAEAYERARIEEVRNTPVVTLVQNPRSSVARVSDWKATAVVALIIGFVVALVSQLLPRLLPGRYRVPGWAGVSEPAAERSQIV